MQFGKCQLVNKGRHWNAKKSAIKAEISPESLRGTEDSEEFSPQNQRILHTAQAAKYVRCLAKCGEHSIRQGLRLAA